MQFLSTLLFISGATALGINCRGSGFCMADTTNGAQTVHDQIGTLIANGGGSRMFNSGDQIACASGPNGQICAFYQNGASGSAQEAYGEVQAILDHGCLNCGSIPTQPGNDVSTGELTINFVSNACCSGDCHC